MRKGYFFLFWLIYYARRMTDLVQNVTSYREFVTQRSRYESQRRKRKMHREAYITWCGCCIRILAKWSSMSKHLLTFNTDCP